MKKILVADDAKFMRMMITNIVGKYPNEYQIVGEAENGFDAIKKYQELQPDIVTMDITMPECNGIEAVQGIMKINPNAKIVMVSAMGQQAMVCEAIKAGAKDFIVKPFNGDKILESLAKLSS